MQQILVSPKDFGVAVRDIRKQQGFTQTELGKRVGLDQKKVSLIENGNPNIRLDSLFRLLSALDMGVTLQSKINPDSSGMDDW